MNDEQKRNIIQRVEESEEWEKIETTVPGVFIVKAPTYNNKQNVFVELIPTSNNQFLKRKGIFIKNIEELNAFTELIENNKVRELVEVISSIYSSSKLPKIEI